MKKLLLLLSCVLICLLLGGCGNPKKEAAGLYDKYYGENGSVVKLAMDMYRKSTKSGITAFEMRQIYDDYNSGIAKMTKELQNTKVDQTNEKLKTCMLDVLQTIERRNASAMGGWRDSIVGLTKSLGGLVAKWGGFIAGMYALNEVMNLWTKYEEVVEQTNRALNGNIDAIQRFGKGGDLEGWYEFLTILNSITGIDFGNLEQLKQGGANYLALQTGNKNQEQIEK